MRGGGVDQRSEIGEEDFDQGNAAGDIDPGLVHRAVPESKIMLMAVNSSGIPVVVGATMAPGSACIGPAVTEKTEKMSAVMADKVKFTVSVQGHQWSSARHVEETLQEFAAVIQRNARRLEFIEEGDGIQRLQLANGDGSEPEDLDVDATLGDVIICMGNKQLIAVVNSAKPQTNTGRPETEKLGPASPLALASLHKPKNKSDTSPINSTTENVIDVEISALGPPRLMLPPYKPTSCRIAHPKLALTTCGEPVCTRGLKIAIPPAEPGQVAFREDRSCAFHQDYACERLSGNQLPPIMPARTSSLNGKVNMMCGGKGFQGSHINFASNSNLTPSPAELAQYLVRSSSQQHRLASGGLGSVGIPPGPGNFAQCNRSTPSGGFQSFASALLSRLPVMPINNLQQCPSHGTTSNIALLAQFLASQLRTFVPQESNAHPSADSAQEKKDFAPVKDVSPICSSKPQPNLCSGLQPPEKEDYVELAGAGVKNGSLKLEGGNMKLSVSGSHDKDESSSSANVNITAAPSSDAIDSEIPNGRSDLIFLVNRRSKTGAGTHHLRMSDLSTYFHLSVVDAAKKLGVSQTTLKKACRKFGLKRWPGRKVRSLESTIHGLEHTIAVGQGAGLEELTEAYMRSEVSKLQQEMDQLVHGTPAQHSPAVRTADLYKRLYSRGWRSKYHSPGRHDLELNNTNDNENCGVPLLAKKTIDQKVVSSGGTKSPGLPTNQQNSIAKAQNNKLVLYSEHDHLAIQVTAATTKDATMKGNGCEIHAKESNKEASQVDIRSAMVAVDDGALAEKRCAGREVNIDENPKEIAYSTERSPKRPKRECRSAAESASRQGLRSSTCAM